MLGNLPGRVDGFIRTLFPRCDDATALRFQARQLRRLVRHCYENVPHYRRSFQRAGVRPEDIRGLDDLPKIPLTSRQDIQDCAPGDICARGVNPGSLLVRMTSGSSGAPITIRRGWLEEQVLLFLRLRWKQAVMGFRPRERRVNFYYDGVTVPWRAKLRSAWHERIGLFPKAYVNWAEPHRELIARLIELQPKILGGAPSKLSWLADELTDEDRRRIHPRLVTVSGELCTDTMRRQIEQGYGAPLLEGYASHEFVGIAQRFPGETSFHVFGTSLIVEVLKDGQPVAPGETGELVGTALHSWAMPFLRYRLGDLVRRSASDLAHPLSVLGFESVHGRVMDRFELTGGHKIHPYRVTTVFRDKALWVRRFQIVQTDRNAFWVRIVAYEEPGEEAAATLASDLRATFPEEVSVRLEFVKELTTTATGKFYPYVSLERYLQWGKKPEP